MKILSNYVIGSVRTLIPKQVSPIHTFMMMVYDDLYSFGIIYFYFTTNGQITPLATARSTHGYTRAKVPHRKRTLHTIVAHVATLTGRGYRPRHEPISQFDGHIAIISNTYISQLICGKSWIYFITVIIESFVLLLRRYQLWLLVGTWDYAVLLAFRNVIFSFPCLLNYLYFFNDKLVYEGYCVLIR